MQFIAAAVLRLVDEGKLGLDAHVGEFVPGIPTLLGRDKFVDRSYWEQVKVERDADGQPAGLAYGDFQGTAFHKRQ
jgi:hypothetical protein